MNNTTHFDSSDYYSQETTELPVVSTQSVGSFRNEDLAKVEIAVQAVILVLALFGNTIVLVSLFQRRKKLSRMHLFILHLCLADIFVAFCNVLPQMIWDITFRFRGGDFLCRLVKYVQVVAMFASSYVLVVTAIDRYFAICHPFTSHKWTTKRVHLMTLTAWLLSFALSIPQLVIFSYRLLPSGIYDCWVVFKEDWSMKLYITWNTTCIYIIPTLLLALSYGLICYTVWKRGRISMKPTVFPRHGNPTSTQVLFKTKTPSKLLRGFSEENVSVHGVSSQSSGISRAKIRTVVLTLTVVICYLVCWAPFFIAQMWAAFDQKAPFFDASYAIVLLLASLNSCTNPWIYLAFSICQGSRRRVGRRYQTDDENSSMTVIAMSEKSIQLHSSSWQREK